ncbi:MAG: hypothetical protein K0S54_1120, partial [Alphaproteobacteria bacterium]|nr:hypothetical protein [Alphaproteobacteria bacterium]
LHDRYSNYADAFRQWGQVDNIAGAGPWKRSKSNWRTA